MVKEVHKIIKNHPSPPSQNKTIRHRGDAYKIKSRRINEKIA